MHDLDQEIVLANGLILPSPRQILDRDIQLHTAVIERQKALLEDILKCEVSLRNAIPRHKQSHENFNMRRIIEKQQRYDRYYSLENNLRKLEGDIKSLHQDLDQDIKRLNQLRNQATSSSYNNSASNNNDWKVVKKDPCKIGTHKWYQSHISCLFHRQQPSKIIPEDEELTNDEWYVEMQLVSPARDSLSGLSNG